MMRLNFVLVLAVIVSEFRSCCGATEEVTITNSQYSESGTTMDSGRYVVDVTAVVAGDPDSIQISLSYFNVKNFSMLIQGALSAIPLAMPMNIILRDSVVGASSSSGSFITVTRALPPSSVVAVSNVTFFGHLTLTRAAPIVLITSVLTLSTISIRILHCIVVIGAGWALVEIQNPTTVIFAGCADDERG